MQKISILNISNCIIIIWIDSTQNNFYLSKRFFSENIDDDIIVLKNPNGTVLKISKKELIESIFGTDKQCCGGCCEHNENEEYYANISENHHHHHEGCECGGNECGCGGNECGCGGNECGCKH